MHEIVYVYVFLIFKVLFLLNLKILNVMANDIIWAHAVNSQSQLNDVLNIKSNVTMIEADVLMGRVENDCKNQIIPIMCHPPNNTSDLSLESFIRQIIKFNNQHEMHKKGFKLDFKSTQVVKESQSILQNYYEMLKKTSVWLNADILPGPIKSTLTPVSSETLFAVGKLFPEFEFSLGWTTNVIFGQSGFYSMENINDMLRIIKGNKFLENRKITFALRTIFAINSVQNIQTLINSVDQSTITLWTAFKKDILICDTVKNFVRNIGIEKFYFDLPNDIIQCIKN